MARCCHRSHRSLDFVHRGSEVDALTMIDEVTNIVEVIRISNKTASHIAMQFENIWLSRYPRPQNVIPHPHGGVFTGYEFYGGCRFTTSTTGQRQRKIRQPTQYASGCIKQSTIHSVFFQSGYHLWGQHWRNSLRTPPLPMPYTQLIVPTALC
jgi:hypothetical protein